MKITVTNSIGCFFFQTNSKFSKTSLFKLMKIAQGELIMITYQDLIWSGYHKFVFLVIRRDLIAYLIICIMIKYWTFIGGIRI